MDEIPLIEKGDIPLLPHANRARCTKTLQVWNLEIQIDDSLTFELRQDRLGMLPLHAVFEAHSHDINLIRQMADPNQAFQLAFKSRDLACPDLIQRQP